MTDTFSWSVEYTDGTMFHEHDAEAQGGAWGLVDAQRVRAIFLIPQQYEPHVHVVVIPDGALPIFFRRRSVVAETNESLETITCAGWRMGETSGFLWIWDSGKVAMTDRDLREIAWGEP